MKHKTWLSGVIVLSVLLSGCGNGKAEMEPVSTSQETNANDSNNEHSGHDHTVLANGDIQEKTQSPKELPAFLDGHSEEMRKIYLLSAQYADVLEFIPCYCGCGESAGHKSNLNCFIKEIEADGAVVWDDHGTRCNVCLDIAVSSAKMAHDGSSVLEIREAMDSAYKQGYAKPTPTPMPEA
ncbi:PCYCGC motif-containing (lipo)protein [Paenibacillus sp. Marseille-Q4541]|uniref:PCYCGC motif-containing (lipo)protein n=1 Tax=Paenibacillus sp. Marseille-Q4541 TaxID=2831522 RepID=UPI001BA835B5|nr:PCYCGC motif-containing (lipo)protein [Paenibacillus sp. Marseille-Q4541]